MNTTLVPTMLLALLLPFASFGALVFCCFIALCIAMWRDDRKARREKKAADDEYTALYDAMIAHVEVRRQQ